MNNSLPLDQVLVGDCIERLAALPEHSVDLVFADPPYNLQLQGELWRPNMTRVDAVDDAWDRFTSFEEYDRFTLAWLTGCRRVLKETGAIWVIGSYHNIYRLGALMQNLGFWFLNDIVWIKTNPMPNFRGVRFTNAHETLIWAAKAQGGHYTFNHHAMKSMNDDLQMRSDWLFSICSGDERIKENGKKVHSTQKPEALLYRVILATTNPGDLILDPFLGSGTTAAVAKKLHRHWIGIERDEDYARIAQERINRVNPEAMPEALLDLRSPKQRRPRLPFARLLECGLLQPGQTLYFQSDRSRPAPIKPDGNLWIQGFEGSIHKTGSFLMGGSPCNGWEHWYYEAEDGELYRIDRLRQLLLDKTG